MQQQRAEKNSIYKTGFCLLITLFQAKLDEILSNLSQATLFLAMASVLANDTRKKEEEETSRESLNDPLGATVNK